MNFIERWWERRQFRIDRNPVYIAAMAAIAVPSLSIVLYGPVPTSNVKELPVPTQIALCICILTGCVMALRACLIREPKRAYRLGATWLPLTCGGLFTYGLVVLTNTDNASSALGGFLTPALGGGLAAQAVFMWLEARRIARKELELTKRAADGN